MITGILSNVFAMENQEKLKRMLAIGNDSPAGIYCLGNVELLIRERAEWIIGARVCNQDG